MPNVLNDAKQQLIYSGVVTTQLKIQIHDLQVFIDGPYGTPSGDIFQAEHAVLIGAGIGVTPFASILQSIVLRYRNARQVCPRCNHGWTGYIPTSVMRLKKVCWLLCTYYVLACVCIGNFENTLFFCTVFIYIL